jgi:hypothetical protein
MPQGTHEGHPHRRELKGMEKPCPPRVPARGTPTIYGLASRLPFARIYPFLANRYLLIVLSILDLQPYVQLYGPEVLLICIILFI